MLTWLLRGYGPSGELQAWGVTPGFKVNQTLAIDQGETTKKTMAVKFLKDTKHKQTEEVEGKVCYLNATSLFFLLRS